jgi:DNA (cytosine-5)-methyltransferase 1
MPAYYNEVDPYAAQWLRNLISAGHIAPGDVDERSILEVKPDDLRVYTQCHFFAGIGVWSYALRCAGWPDSRSVWTGSCPCQPFSAAGKGQADEDDRHLWPEWLRLIRELSPATVFGEQVSAAIRIGWLDDVFASLEEIDYSCGAIDFPASSVGAPHIRQRTYFVAARELADTERAARQRFGQYGRQRLCNEETNGLGQGGVLGHTEFSRGQRPANADLHGARRREERRDAGSAGVVPGAVSGFWRDAEWIRCIDGRSRPTKPGVFPLVARFTGLVGMLRAAGNSIVAPQAAEFVGAYLDMTNARSAP